ncbi:MAG TPA: ABC transporter permease [Acidobacteriaceae bacterium]|jgi:predicted permease|nr:ABC transporter permease [Acidobacteriaceae bacterium]
MFRDLLYRFRTFFRRQRVHAEIDEELQYHLERETEKYRQAGASPEEAMRRARLVIGGPEQVRQQCREAHGTRLMDDLLQDLRYGVRTLGKSPGFTIVVILTLALGIGACTAVFSVVNAVLLRSLPYGDPAHLVYLYTPNPKLKLSAEIFEPVYADFRDLQQQSHSFAAMTTFAQSTYELASRDTTIRIGGARVDGDFFRTLQSPLELGRPIDAHDTEPGHDGVVILSHALWQNMFAGSMDVLTKSLRLGGKTYRIIGVMPVEFQYPHKTDLAFGNSHIAATQVWVPFVLSPQQKADRDGPSGEVVARLKPGVTVAQAQAEMSTIMARLNLLHAAVLPRDWRALVKPFLDLVVGPVRPLMWLLLGAVSFVLLIACGNAANLLMARAASRTHELGVRATLGAGRSRMVRQMLTESLILGFAGGFVGIALAYVFLHGLLRLNPGNIPRLNEASLDARVLLFTVALSLLTSILFGMLPALSASRINLVEFLKSGGSRGQVRSSNPLHNGLIVAEIGFVVVLLAGAGLLLRSYIHVESIRTGFSQSTVGMNIHLDSRYRQPQFPQRSRIFFQDLIGKLSAIPGIQAVGAVDGLPLSGEEDITFFWVDGYANQKNQWVEMRGATPHYFSAMGTPLMEGRFFTEDDASTHPRVVIINEAFAKAYFHGRDPIGQRVRVGAADHPWVTVVGVIGDVRLAHLEEAAAPQVYDPFDGEDSASIAVRSTLPPQVVTAAVRSTLKTIDPNLAMTDIHTMGELVSEATARRRFQTTLLTVFAAMALLLVLVGFYGLLAYSVKQRTAEIGLRIALGAPRARVLGMILRQGLQLVLAGLLFGLAGAVVLTRVLTSSLYGVQVLDPVTFLVVPILLLLVTLAASLIPGWKAAGVDPAIALRSE